MIQYVTQAHNDSAFPETNLKSPHLMYQEMKQEINELVSQIQKEFGKDSIFYKEENLTMA